MIDGQVVAEVDEIVRDHAKADPSFHAVEGPCILNAAAHGGV